MKLAIINDTHIGPHESGFKAGVHRKLTDQSESVLKEIIHKLNSEVKPEFVVMLGDAIEDVNDRDTDIQYFKRAIGLISELDMPVKWLIGNHDVRTLEPEDVAQLLGYEKMYYSFDTDEFHFVALSFVMTGNHREVKSDITAQIPADQLSWLKNDLQHTSKPTVVFCHYGVAEDDMVGNFWFEGSPQYALLGNREELRQILEQSNKVKAVISAHQHWNRMHEHNGIPYFVVTSLAENTNNDDVIAAAYTIVDLSEEKIIVDVQGNDPARFEYSFSNN